MKKVYQTLKSAQLFDGLKLKKTIIQRLIDLLGKSLKLSGTSTSTSGSFDVRRSHSTFGEDIQRSAGSFDVRRGHSMFGRPRPI